MAAGEEIEYTKEMIEEYIRCKEDIFYFAEKYFYIISLDDGRVLIPLREYQKRMLKAFVEPSNDRRNLIVCSARQIGKSTIMTLFILHYIIFSTHKTAALLANNERTSIDLLRKVKESYESLPLWMQPGIMQGGWSKTQVALDNGCRLISGSTGSNAIRGSSINLLCLDEFAFVPDNVADEFMSSVYPTVSSGTSSKIIMVSTPNGMNHFFTIWINSIRGSNNFMPVQVDWWEVPGRDQAWKDRIVSDIGPLRFSQEFACKFIGSTPTLIDSSSLTAYAQEFIVDPIEFKINGVFRIYEHPKQGFHYVLGVDTSMGIGADYSVIQVLKIISENEIEQVAVYENNSISYVNFSTVIIGVAELYNRAYIMIENNDIGGHVANKIWYDDEYDNIINTDKKNIGTRSTRATKLGACLNLKRYIESGMLIVHDSRTVVQLSTFEEVAPNIYKASGREHDDLVSALYWALFFLKSTQVDFDIDGNMTVNKERTKSLDEDSLINSVVIFGNESSLDEDGFDWGEHNV